MSKEKTAKSQTPISEQELKEYTNQLYIENQKLKEEVLSYRQQGPLIRLEFLFKVIENKDSFDKEFIESTAKEIQEALKINSDTKKESK